MFPAWTRQTITHVHSTLVCTIGSFWAWVFRAVIGTSRTIMASWTREILEMRCVVWTEVSSWAFKAQCLLCYVVVSTGGAWERTGGSLWTVVGGRTRSTSWWVVCKSQNKGTLGSFSYQNARALHAPKNHCLYQVSLVNITRVKQVDAFTCKLNHPWISQNLNEQSNLKNLSDINLEKF